MSILALSHHSIRVEDLGFDYELEAKEIMAGREIIAARANESGKSVNDYLREKNKMRSIKRWASKIGLNYYPALLVLDRLNIDIEAILVADRILTAKNGAYGTYKNNEFVRGGWDMEGHYGLSPFNIARFWIAAGCKNTPKFRLQVRSGYALNKGDSLAFSTAYVRGMRWLENNNFHPSWIAAFSRKAVATLGRLSPQLRRAAVQRFFSSGRFILDELNEDITRIRIRHLDWKAVKQASKLVERSKENPRVLAALSGKQGAARILLGKNTFTEDELVKALCPYPNLGFYDAAQIALGKSPVDLSSNKLTKKEAHQWLVDGKPNINAWLAEKYEIPFHRSVEVQRWVAYLKLDKKRWEAFTRSREARRHNEVFHYSCEGILDEIMPSDLLTGRDSVTAVIERANNRLSQDFMAEQMKDHRPLNVDSVWFDRFLPKYMQRLNTAAQLAKEGADLKHCVGTYAEAVENGSCYILSIRTRCGRSTVELQSSNNGELYVSQHYAASNTPPSVRHDWLLRAWLMRVNKISADDGNYARAA